QPGSVRPRVLGDRRALSLRDPRETASTREIDTTAATRVSSTTLVSISEVCGPQAARTVDQATPR
ncbi:MAG: hypothetical protein ACOYO2_10590, partial [Mycobacterium sp.]